MHAAKIRLRHQKRADNAQIIADKTMQELKETERELASRRLQLSAGVSMYLKRQISRLNIKMKSLRHRLYLNNLDKLEKQAKLRNYDNFQVIKQKLDTINKEKMDLESAIKFHKKALKKAKKAKKAEDKDAHNLKIADLEEEYEKVCMNERVLNVDHFKVRKALGLR